MSQKDHTSTFKKILAKLGLTTSVINPMHVSDNTIITEHSSLDDDTKFKKPTSLDDSDDDEFSSPWSSDNYWSFVHDRFNELVQKYNLTSKQIHELFNLIRKYHLSGKPVNFDAIETRASEMQLDSYNRSHQSTHRGRIHIEIDADGRDR